MSDHRQGTLERRTGGAEKAEGADHGVRPFKRFIFSEKIKCGDCGASFISRNRKKKGRLIF
jgi:hypothetical protein